VRKFRWPIVALVILVFAAGAAALRRPANDFPELNPYIVGQRTDYVQAQPWEKATGIYGTPAPAACRHTVYWLRGIKLEQLLPLLEAHAMKKGLPVTQLRTAPFLYFEASKNHQLRFDCLRATRGTSWTPYPVPHQEESIKADFSVEEGTPMSEHDVLVLRIRYLGMNPFAH
jgi:hypothetical protein